MEPIHRDDLPMDVAEEMVKKLQELHPGCKIVFMGDQPGGVPPEMQADLDQFAQAQERAFAEGRCMDCDKPMPGWPSQGGAPDQLPDGWTYFTDLKDQPMGWLCPECDAADVAESER